VLKDGKTKNAIESAAEDGPAVDPWSRIPRDTLGSPAPKRGVGILVPAKCAKVYSGNSVPAGNLCARERLRSKPIKRYLTPHLIPVNTTLGFFGLTVKRKVPWPIQRMTPKLLPLLIGGSS
jgi:hypothetical protein